MEDITGELRYPDRPQSNMVGYPVSSITKLLRIACSQLIKGCALSGHLPVQYHTFLNRDLVNNPINCRIPCTNHYMEIILMAARENRGDLAGRKYPRSNFANSPYIIVTTSKEH